MRGHMKKVLQTLAVCSVAISFSACSSASKVLNPFYEEPGPHATMGQPNDHALNEGGSREEGARDALEALATYERANSPAPYKPVVRPDVVRLMWVPPRLNKYGDLVGEHYYYLKVKEGGFAATDAFEIESQLGRKGDTSNLPYIRGKFKGN